MRSRQASIVLRSCLLLLAGLSFRLASAQEQRPVEVSRGTPDRWGQAGWWPTKGASKHGEYAGTAACRACHAEIVTSQLLTPMSRAAALPVDAQILLDHPELHYSDDTYQYLLSHYAGGAVQTAKSNRESISAAVGWAFGTGEVAQTYIFKSKDAYLESRLSYYNSLHALGITTGHSAEPPGRIGGTLGDEVDAETIRRCFGCHATASTVGGIFDPEHATLGVTCEACHGPGLKHVDVMSSPQGQRLAASILNPKTLSPVESVDFCGACHRTPVDVAVYVQADLGVAAVRFQPYRLERSLCWGSQGDRRIICVACHDPHKPLVRDLAAYDANCLQCHAGSQAGHSASAAPACKVAAKDCASCHMPRVEVSATHATFTDHFIRVVRPGSGFRQ